MERTMAETAKINGTELAYLEHGQGQPVVFVHGGFGDYREWELQVPAFAASFRTITLSCRGAWPNRKLEADEKITLDTFVEDLAAFIKALDLAPVHLVGHSSPGGFGGLLLAHRYPELLRSLVLLEPPTWSFLLRRGGSLDHGCERQAPAGESETLRTRDPALSCLIEWS